MIKPYYHNSHFSFLFIYQAPIHRYAMRVLYLANHNDTVQTAYTVYITKRVKHKVLIVLHVMGINLYQEVVVARGVIALGYLVNGLHSIHKLLN